MFNWFWKFLYGLVKSILYCIDFILGLCKKLAGIDTVDYRGRPVELLDFFMRNGKVLDAFKGVAVIGVLLIFLFSAFAMLRSVGKMGEEKTTTQVFYSLLTTLFYLLLVPVIMIVGSTFVTTLMTSLNIATSNGSSGLGSSMFVVFVEQAYEGAPSTWNDVADRFLSGELDYYSTSQVDAYFDLSEINYFLAFVSGVAVLVLLVKPLLTFVERIISLILLFVVAPLSVSTVPLDDGVRFKLWREQVLNKFLTAYGALIAINLFALLLGVISDVTFFKDGSAFENRLAQLVFILGGAAATNMGVVVFGNLVNQGAGSQHAADRAHMAGSLMAAGHTAGAVGKKIQNSSPVNAASNKIKDVGHRATAKVGHSASRVSNVAKGLAGAAYDKTLGKPMGAVKEGIGKAYDKTLGRAIDKAKDFGHRLEDIANRRNNGGENPVANAIAAGSHAETSSNDNHANVQSSQNILNSLARPNGNKRK